ncbi:MAG: glutathione S-transferase N-terminal domain-containing protein [Polyangiales bacterium]|nr:glutathione S-transferase domain-containing protein [Myxococcales bacterium]MCB9658032.1 glutathione S-transferase domain-containing protein [Sandaracinaceae bacterium]
MRTLVALSYSPWSEKARWALDHHGVAYTYKEYKILLGEPQLRIATRNATGKATVPVLFDDGEVLGESWDIAHRAEAVGRGPTLFPEPHREAIRAWHERGQDACALARVGLIEKIRQDPEAMRAQIDAGVPRGLRPLMYPSSSLVMAWFANKHHGACPGDGAALRDACHALRRGLAGREHLFDQLTFADMAMAVMLQFVQPVSDTFIPLDPRTRRAWEDPALAREFADLLEWRDGLYARHRGQQAQAAT